MKGKVLIVSAAANMIQQFNIENIKILQKIGYEVHVGTNMIRYGSMSENERDKMMSWLDEHGVKVHQVDFERRLGTIKSNVTALNQLNMILKNDDFAFVHAQSPIGGVLGRIAAKRRKVKSIYTAHGFHFFKGGSKINWLIFYPLEKMLSRITDTLILINDEDYNVARNFHQKHIYKIPGVGINVRDAINLSNERLAEIRHLKRTELGFSDKDFILFSTGELSDRKNHRVVLEAMNLMKEKTNIHYLIAGVGQNKPILERLALDFGIQDRLHFLGYRNDIRDLNIAADINVFPSLREGLGLSGLEAIVTKTFLVGNENTAMREYVDDKVGAMFNGTDARTLSVIISKVYRRELSFSDGNMDRWMKFDKSSVNRRMEQIYRQAGE